MKAPEATEETERLLAMVAHDLRAPVRQIGVRLALMQRRYADAVNGSFSEDVAEMSGQIRALQELLEDMLRWAAGDASDEADSVMLQSAVEDCQSMLAEHLKHQSAQLLVEVPAELTVLVRSDALLRVLMNLVRNAVDHGEPGVQVSIRAKSAPNGMAEIRVSDNGPGVPEDVRPRIFQPFERGHARSKGTGLGLAICKRLIENAGGEISLEPDSQDGACFRFTLPQA